MPMPFLHRYFPSSPGEGSVERLIDNEYQLERVAAGDADDAPLDEYLRFLHDTGRAISVESLAPLSGKDKAGAAAALRAVLTAPAPVGTAAFSPADTVADDRAAHLGRLRERGAQVEQVLSNPTFAGGESQLLIEAARALKNGMVSEGRDQQEEFKDAIGLFREAREGAIGNRNYIVWFQIGWVLWKQGAEPAEAEEAFYQAYRLSSATQDVFYYLSQRHRAYLQFLQNKPAEAYDTIQRAVLLYESDPDILMDAARYAAAAGKSDDACRFARELLGAEPSQGLTLFAETAFAPVLPLITEAVWQVFEQGERRAAAAVARLGTAQTDLQTVSERSGFVVAPPPEMIAGVEDARSLLKRHATALSYPWALGVVRTATDQANALYDYARKALEDENAAIDQRLVRPRRQIERLLSEQKRWKEDAAKVVRAAKQSKIDLSSPPRRSIFGRYNPEHATLYENYQTARGQMEINARAVKDELPTHEADIAHGEDVRRRIAETIAWLEERQRVTI